ncbi:MAG: thiol-disulfide oxidoreductase DCC family protein [Flavisolibacter sp.]
MVAAKVFIDKVDKQPLILFDGLCNFCNAAINFIVARDKKMHFWFAALQSEAAKPVLSKYDLADSEFSSFIFIDKNKAYWKSTAALKVCNQLPWYWKWTQIFWLVPPYLRDQVYSIIARNRYKWFGKKDQCMVPDIKIRSRFLL